MFILAATDALVDEKIVYKANSSPQNECSKSKYFGSFAWNLFLTISFPKELTVVHKLFVSLDAF